MSRRGLGGVSEGSLGGVGPVFQAFGVGGVDEAG